MPKEMTKPPRLDVKVTQRQIDTAVPANSGHCMIADAVKEAFTEKFKRKPLAVSVDLQTIRLSDKKTGKRFIYLTPVVAQRGLLQFDQGITPTEFNFRLHRGQIVQPRKRSTTPQEMSTAQVQQRDEATAASKRKAYVRARLEVSSTNAKHRGDQRDIIGGKAPPLAVLSGNRRQFGVRAAGSLNGPTQ